MVGGPSVGYRQPLSQTAGGCGCWDGVERDGINHDFDGLGEIECAFGRRARRRDGVGDVSAKLTADKGVDAGGRGGFIRFS